MIKIDEALLIKLAGVGAFGRGLHILEEGRVRKIESTEGSTSAIVCGNHQYDVQLRHTHRLLEGACDCPDSQGIGFCKHCVAVALALQEDQAPTKPITKKSAIRRNLSRLTHDELTEEFLRIVGRDRALRIDLLQKAQFASGA